MTSRPASATSTLELLVYDSVTAVADEAARRLWQGALQQPHRALGLATGRTMEPVYGAFVALWRQAGAADRQAIREGWLSFNLDEYVGLEAGDPRSFSAYMRAHLGQPLGLRPEQLRLPQAPASDPAAAARLYGDAVARAGGLGLQLLGLGLNGHVGFNEPPCPAEAPCRCVDLSAITRRQNAAAFGGDPQAVPPRAISLGLREILAARSILLVVTGSSKAPILRRLLEEPPSVALPASWLKCHPAVTVLADREALA